MHIGTRMVLLEYRSVFGSLITKKKLAMPLGMLEKSEISGFFKHLHYSVYRHQAISVAIGERCRMMSDLPLYNITCAPSIRLAPTLT